jgi:hypothetical protein
MALLGAHHILHVSSIRVKIPLPCQCTSVKHKLYYSKYSAAGLILLQIHHQSAYKNLKVILTAAIYANQDRKLLDRLKNLELHT